MVDFYGNWTYEPNTPEKDKCDCDRIADEVMKYLDNIEPQSRLYGYKIETSIEHIVEMIYAYLEDFINYSKFGINEMMLKVLMTKEKDEKGNIKILWGHQKITND